MFVKVHSDCRVENGSGADGEMGRGNTNPRQVAMAVSNAGGLGLVGEKWTDLGYILYVRLIKPAGI